MAKIGGLILAGGLSRRMNGPEKSTLLLQGKTMLEHVIERISPQVGELVLNANGEPERFNSLNLPIVADDVPDHPGPLAGLIAGMDWMQKNAPDTEWMLSVPCDTPILPSNLATRLMNCIEEEKADIALAGSAGRAHPVIGLWRVSLLDDLRQAVVHEDVRKVRAFTGRHKEIIIDWPSEPMDPFSNINTPQELEAAQSWF